VVCAVEPDAAFQPGSLRPDGGSGGRTRETLTISGNDFWPLAPFVGAHGVQFTGCFDAHRADPGRSAADRHGTRLPVIARLTEFLGLFRPRGTRRLKHRRT